MSSYVLYPVIPRSNETKFQGKEPLIMALKNSSFKSFELLIEILMLDPYETPYISLIK